ncbi:MAG: hypothetical protein A4E71_00171 [Smithella sp. PtaU1.Bin162]|nr:MAG: hypothetical protein A4E71_00171 [Smithella sp. PtaU1.Bin162]
MDVSVGINKSQILCIEKSFLIEGFAVGIIVFEISGHYGFTFKPYFSYAVGIDIFDFYFISGNRWAHGSGFCFFIVGNGNRPGRFSQPVPFHDVKTHPPVIGEIFFFQRGAAADEKPHLPAEDIMYRLKNFLHEKIESAGLKKRRRF